MAEIAATAQQAAPLLGPDEPPPVEVVNPDGRAGFLLVCDHASNRIPAALDRLGLDEAALGRHIALDIGAGEVTRALAAALDAPAVLASYSRLVIDNNRQLYDPTSIPEISDGTIVPGNSDLPAEQAQARVDRLFRPYHDRVKALLTGLDKRLDDGAGRAPLISIHSFTPVFKSQERPWHIGLLWNRDPRLPKPLLKALAENRGLIVDENVPYTARDPYGYTNYEHADSAGRANVLIEIRQDLIDTRQGAETYARLIADALEPVLKDPGLYREERY